LGDGAQPDGRIVVAGEQGSTFAARRCIVVRYLPNGLLDPSFGGGGVATTDVSPDGSELLRAVSLQPDGRIVAGGEAA
jgi:hypothetical protein